MMNGAKLQLSPAEIALLCDPKWILTKNAVIAKMVDMMAELSDLYKEEWDEPNAGWTLRDRDGSILGPGTPKISKGENYKGLPYVVLDYPRHFDKEDILAIRTMFWWGNYFTITLHLKGYYKQLFMPVITRQIDMFLHHSFYIGVSPDEWRHEWTVDNYVSMMDMERSDIKKLLHAHPHLKFSAMVGFDNMAVAPKMLQLLFRVIVNVLPYQQQL